MDLDTRARRGRAAGRAGWNTLAALSLVANGCTAIGWVGIRTMYEPAVLPEAQISRDLVYAERPGGALALDLYRPERPGWPVIVFAYGGGWTDGDKNLSFAGVDLYGNIGRYFAAHGIGVAVIDYRLQPRVTWREQVDDVATAAAWVREHVGEYGGDGSQLFLAGHSAGAQLASAVGMDRTLLAAHGLEPEDISGVVAVGPAGVNLEDRRQFRLGASERYFRNRFSSLGGDWRREGSIVRLATAEAPPFLIAYATQDPAWLSWQAEMLYGALRRKGAPVEADAFEHENHYTLVLALSRAGSLTDSVISFVARRTELAKLRRQAGSTTAGSSWRPPAHRAGRS